MCSLLSLLRLAAKLTARQTSRGRIARLRPFDADTPAEIAPSQPHKPSVVLPSRGEVDIRGISALYSTELRPALDNVSLLVKPGWKVTIYERTGSGKSTLLLTLFRMLGLDSGTILVDGLDITSLPQDELRPLIIAVPQEPVLFPGSLRSFMQLHEGELTDEHIMSRLDKVGLGTR